MCCSAYLVSEGSYPLIAKLALNDFMLLSFAVPNYNQTNCLCCKLMLLVDRWTGFKCFSVRVSLTFNPDLHTTRPQGTANCTQRFGLCQWNPNHCWKHCSPLRVRQACRRADSKILGWPRRKLVGDVSHRTPLQTEHPARRSTRTESLYPFLERVSQSIASRP